MPKITIPDPNSWIKNTQLLFEQSEDPKMNKLAVVFLDNENKDRASFNQSFIIRPMKELSEDVLEFLTKLISTQATQAKELVPEIDKIAVLAIHDDIDTAAEIIEAVEAIAEFFELKTAAAIVANDSEWIDVYEGKTGPVDASVITDFELYSLIEGDVEFIRLDPDGNVID